MQIVNDDMPFLVDSIANECNRREINVHLLAHPVLAVRRDLDGDLLGFAIEAGERAKSESMMHIEIDRQADPALLDELAAALTRVLAEVRLAVEDWRAMRRACLDAIPDLAASRSPSLAEYDDFLRWLEADHFTFLGHRRYRYVEDASQAGGLRYEIVPGSPLGILRRDEVRLFEAGLGGGEAMSRFARGPGNILIVKTDRPSLVHRTGPMDCVIVKTYDADGRVTGERRLVGLFTSAAYHATVRDVPLLRGRVDSILRRSGLDVHSHDGKALLAILEAYPRDELFQIDEDTLYDHVLGILQLQERRRVALFARRDAVGRFATCLVFAPRERFDAALSDHFAAILEQAWQGKVQSVDVSVSSDSALAQVLYTLKLESNDTPTPDLAELERALAEAATSWSDRFRAALQETLGEPEGRAAARRWRDWFPAVYRDSFDANQAVADLDLVQAALAGRPFGVRLDRAPDLPMHRFTLRLFHPKAPLALSDILPLAENLGLRVLSEAPFLLKSGDEAVALQVLSVETADKSPVDLAHAGPRFAEALDKVWARALESDGLNRLVLGAGLAWREVAILRTYAKYLRQAGIAFSQDYMERVLSSYPAIARLVIDLFLARFDPALGEAASDARKQKLEPLEAEITGALEGVATLDEDRILRRFLNAVRCTLRTNYWQPAGQGLDLHQDRQPRHRRAAGAAAPGRDLRLQPAHGGHPSARRPGGARRHPLVRPARGFPHRDPGPDEDPDGEERRHRAGGLQGRLLRQAATGRRHARAGPGRGHRLLPDADPRPARHHRQLRRRRHQAAGRRGAARSATIPISWSRPTRARRPSPTSPMRSPRNTASGSTMPSPRAARRATTTRRWASPPAAPGNW